MIVYRELSSLCHDLGYSARALYAASNSIFKHYHTVSIPKSNGEQRVLHVPDKYLKSIQKSIVNVNIKMYKKWKIKMYIFSQFSASVASRKARLSFKRYDGPFTEITTEWCNNLSNTALARVGDPKISPHLENGILVVIMVLFFS